MTILQENFLHKNIFCSWQNVCMHQGWLGYLLEIAPPFQDQKHYIYVDPNKILINMNSVFVTLPCSKNSLNKYIHYHCKIMSILEKELKPLGDFKVMPNWGKYLQKVQLYYILTFIYYRKSIIKMYTSKIQQEF